MILNNPENRKVVVQYLRSVSEDDLIDDVIIPLFAHYGYRLYRKVRHGPGEQGRDLIFVRYEPLHLSEQFIAVQAKAEKVTVGNVGKFVNQVDRAMKTRFKRLGSGGRASLSFVFFMNSRTHTNDAHEDFHQMIAKKSHTRIFAQEHLADLMLTSGVAPRQLLDELSHAEPIEADDINREVYTVLTNGTPADVDKLLDRKVPLVRGEVTPRMRKMIVDYAFQIWKEDPSWDGTVRPMRWLNAFFDFIAENQYPLLSRVINEVTATYPSKAAAYDASVVLQKLRPEHLQAFEDDFAMTVAKQMLAHDNKWSQIAGLVHRAVDEGGSKNAILIAALKYDAEKKKPKDERDIDAMKAAKAVFQKHAWGDDDD